MLIKKMNTLINMANKIKSYVGIDGDKITAINCSLWQVIKYWLRCKLTKTRHNYKELKDE